MTNYSVFDLNSKEEALKDQKCFFGNPVAIARYDRQRHPIFEKLTVKQMGFFWQPTEIDLSKDRIDFKGLPEHEKHIFTSNLKRQILLDSVQGRAPVATFLPLVSIPELENWIITWSFFETIHSRSYTHIIRNVYSDPSKVFDEMMDIEEIVNCAKDISCDYDNLINATWYTNNKLYDLKRKLWLALMSVNILEGIRFYVSFACSWAFAELKKMEGNAKIIKLIARDEATHLAGTQHLLKILPQEDEEFQQIQDETKQLCIDMFISAIDQEKLWSEYIFHDGSMIGLNKPLLDNYIEWIAHKRMNAVGLKSPYKGGTDPLPWTQKWISGAEVQVANQEVENSQYVIGNVKKDVNKETFGNFKL